MDAKEIVPFFYNFQSGIKSGRPFKFPKFADVNLNTIPEDKWHLIHESLLLMNNITWRIRNEQELLFIINVIKEHKILKIIELIFLDGANECSMNELANVIESSQIPHLSLKKEKNTSNLSQILHSLRNVKTLINLVVHFVPMPAEFEALAYSLQNERIETLILSPKMPVELWTAITPVLSNHKKLKTLVLSLSASEFQAFGKNSSIQDLRLNGVTNNEIAIESIEKLTLALKKSTTVNALTLTQPDFRSAPLALLFESLSHNQTKLSSLRFINIVLLKDDLKALAEALKTNANLTSLSLQNSGFDDDTCQALCGGLAQNTTLNSLNLIYNSLTVAGTTVLCDWLKKNKSLTKLDLSFSQLRDQDCAILADLLMHNTLKGLSLSYNAFGSAGVKYIFEAMMKNTTLHELDIAGISFMNDRVEAIDLLTCNTTLTRLKLDRPTSTNDIYLLASEGLKHNKSLRQLCIEISHYDDKDSNLNNAMTCNLAEVLKTNFSLDTIVYEVSGAKQEIGAELLEPNLTRNRRLKSEERFKVAILSHNIARSHQALATLPREIWISILSSVTHPGMDPFSSVVKNVFNAY